MTSTLPKKKIKKNPLLFFFFPQDLVIPPMFSPKKYSDSPLFGAPQGERKILAYFKGDLRRDDARMIYSRGLRQKLALLSKSEKWWAKHRIWVSDHSPPDEPYNSSTYSYALASSIFCFVLPGDGWSGRMEDSILHGCIPVIIQDNVDVSLESIMNVTSFSIRLNQSDIDRVPEILLAVPPAEVERLQAGVKKVWRRYWYGSYAPHRNAAKEMASVWKELEENESEKYVKLEIEFQARREKEIELQIRKENKEQEQIISLQKQNAEEAHQHTQQELEKEVNQQKQQQESQEEGKPPLQRRRTLLAMDDEELQKNVDTAFYNETKSDNEESESSNSASESQRGDPEESSDPQQEDQHATSRQIDNIANILTGSSNDTDIGTADVNDKDSNRAEQTAQMFSEEELYDDAFETILAFLASKLDNLQE